MVGIVSKKAIASVLFTVAAATTLAPSRVCAQLIVTQDTIGLKIIAPQDGQYILTLDSFKGQFQKVLYSGFLPSQADTIFAVPGEGETALFTDLNGGGPFSSLGATASLGFLTKGEEVLFTLLTGFPSSPQRPGERDRALNAFEIGRGARNTRFCANGICETQASHVAVNYTATGAMLGFEDLPLGVSSRLNSDFDYRDLVVRFDLQPSIAPVPEPATWGMMIIGFGVVGTSIRRRKSSVRTTARIAVDLL